AGGDRPEERVDARQPVQLARRRLGADQLANALPARAPSHPLTLLSWPSSPGSDAGRPRVLPGLSPPGKGWQTRAVLPGASDVSRRSAMELSSRNKAPVAAAHRRSSHARAEVGRQPAVDRTQPYRSSVALSARFLAALSLLAVGAVHLHEYGYLYSTIPTIG